MKIPDDIYRLTDKPPCGVGDVVQVGRVYYKVRAIEPLYYEFRNIVGGVDVGFQPNIYPVPDLIPPKDTIYYLTGLGIVGNMRFQLRYQSGSPRNTVGARSTQRLDRTQAPYTTPFNVKFAIIAGDTLEGDVLPAFVGLRGAIWFYGFKIRHRVIKTPPAEVIVLTDVREFTL